MTGSSPIKRLEELLDTDRALGWSEEHFSKLIQGLPAAVYTTDAAGLHITFYNEAAAELWGAVPSSARANSAVPGSSIGPTARRCRTTSARWH